MVSLESTILFLKLFVLMYPLSGLFTYFNLFCLRVLKSEEFKSTLTFLPENVRLGDVHAFLKKLSFKEKKIRSKISLPTSNKCRPF